MKHLHKYKKVNIGSSRGTKSNRDGYWVYRCMKPDCSHYIPVKLAENRVCECNRCGEPMTIGKLQLTGSSNEPMTWPRCAECVRKKGLDDTTIQLVTEFLERVVPSTPEE